MGKRTFLLLALFACLVTAATHPRSGDASLATDIAVTDTIEHSVNGIDLQIRSDGEGAYKNTKAVQSIIQGIGDWELDTDFARTSTRAIYVSFDKPIPGSGPNGGAPIAPFNGGVEVKGRFISKCGLQGVDMLNIPQGSTVVCPLTLGFDYNGTRYRVQMNPGPTGADVDPETDFTDIKCNLAGSGGCIDWTLTPNGFQGGYAGPDVRQNVVRLSKMITSKGQTTPVKQGNFLFSYSIRVTRP